MSFSLQHRDVVGSTMQEARLLAAQDAPHGTTVCARQQTAARGRHGRTWEAPRDAGVYMTTLLRPTPQKGLERLSLVAGVALWSALRRLGADVQLKWPNDLVARGRKCAGILLEADDLLGAAPRIFVGIGINWAKTETLTWPPHLAGRSIGLQDLVPTIAGPADVAAAVLASLESHLRTWQAQGLGPTLEAWAQADALAGKTVRVEVAGAWVRGEACGLAAEGQLMVHTAHGQVRVSSGEVTCVRPGAGDSYV